jgi:ABC-2 type transport system permease protein
MGISNRRYLTLVLALLLIIFAASHSLLQHFAGRVSFDFTADRSFTLDPGARAIIQSLHEPISLTLYTSESATEAAAALKLHAARVRLLLETLEQRAPHRLSVRFIETEPLSPQEDAAIEAGLIGAAGPGNVPFYLGLVGTNLVDERRVIPFLSPERGDLLEFEIIRLIAELDQPPTERVTLISGVELESYDGPRFFYSELARAYDVRLLEPDFDRLPQDAGVVILIHPRALGERQWAAINRHLDGSGRALILADPFSRLAAAPAVRGLRPDRAEAPSDLGPLGQRLGLELASDAVVLDAQKGLPVDVEIEGRVVERIYPVWFRVEPSQMRDDNAIVGPLVNGVNVAAAGALDVRTDKPVGVRHTSLMQSGPESWRVPVDVIADDPLPSVLTATRPDETQAQVLAIMVDGPAASGAEKPGWRVVVIADTDFLDDAFYLSRNERGEPALVADNAALFMNAVDILSGNEALVGLRSAEYRERTLTRIEARQAAAEARLQAEEERLRTELYAARQRLEAARAGRFGIGGSALASAERSVDVNLEIEAAQSALGAARERLREVEREYRRDVNQIALIANLFSVWFLPLVTVFAGIALPLWRAQRQKRREAGS